MEIIEKLKGMEVPKEVKLNFLKEPIELLFEPSFGSEGFLRGANARPKKVLAQVVRLQKPSGLYPDMGIAMVDLTIAMRKIGITHFDAQVNVHKDGVYLTI
jgi:hypothetical protein